MILPGWAARLHAAPPPPAARAALHERDAVAALLTGLRTREGRALARLFRDETAPAARAGALAAIIRLTECDDIHLPSCVTPGAAVVPVAMLLAPDAPRRARAIAAGTAAGLQLGAAVGGAAVLSAGLWPSLHAAPLMAAVTAATALELDADRLAHAMALALAGTAARIGRPGGALPGRWFLFAEAVSRGVRAAQAAAAGFEGDLSLLTEAWLGASAVPALLDLSALEAPAPPGLDAVGFKPFAGARQGINAVLAFRALLADIPDIGAIEAVEVSVPTANLPLLTRPLAPEERLSRLSHLGFQLALAALAPEALFDPERDGLPLPELAGFAARVAVRPSPELDAQFPQRWGARVTLRTAGRTAERELLRTPLDADAPDLPVQLRAKWARLLPPDDQHLLGPEHAPADAAALWQHLSRQADAPAPGLARATPDPTLSPGPAPTERR